MKVFIVEHWGEPTVFAARSLAEDYGDALKARHLPDYQEDNFYPLRLREVDVLTEVPRFAVTWTPCHDGTAMPCLTPSIEMDRSGVYTDKAEAEAKAQELHAQWAEERDRNVRKNGEEISKAFEKARDRLGELGLLDA